MLDISMEQLASAISEDVNYKYVTSNELYNAYQDYANCLILDMREASTFHKAHFFSSINIPASSISVEELLQYDAKAFTDKHFGDPQARKSFELRKRLMVFVIPGTTAIHQFAEDFSFLSKELALDPVSAKNRLLKAKKFAISCLLYQALRKEKVRELHMLKEGFEKLQGRFPFLCLFSESRIYVEPKRRLYPNEILEGKLYLGDQFDAKDIDVIKNLRITHIVNVTSEIPNYFEKEGIKYMRILVEDKEESRIHYYFPRVYGFIESAIFTKRKEERILDTTGSTVEALIPKLSSNRENENEVTREAFMNGIMNLMAHKGYFSRTKPATSIDKEFKEEMQKHGENNSRVLVHCAMGISRSASIIIMYLMKKFNIAFETTLEFVHSKRDKVDPNEGFREQLLQFEQSSYTFMHALGVFTPLYRGYHRSSTIFSQF